MIIAIGYKVTQVKHFTLQYCHFGSLDSPNVIGSFMTHDVFVAVLCIDSTESVTFVDESASSQQEVVR